MLRPLLSLLLVFATLTVAVPAQAEGTPVFAYRGELIDGTNTPISGVFPLTFHLYRQEDSSSSFWQETHWVAAVEGGYDVILGQLAPIEGEWDGQQLYLGVEMGELGEFLRHAYTPVVVEPPQSRDDVIAELDLSFADLADRALFAIEADIAEDCDSIGGMTLEELDRYEEVLEEIAELETQVERATGVQLGSRTTTLERIGGTGGNPYSRTCPPGHVVTGLRGGAGQFIDSIEVICSPLQ